MKATVTSRFLKTFSILSALFFLFMFVVRAFFLADFANFEVYKIIAVLFSVFLTYTSIFPYILAVSLYRAFFYYGSDGGANLLAVTQKTLIIVAVFLALYTSVLVFFSSSISKNIHNIYVSQEYIYLHKSKQAKSTQYLELSRSSFANKDYEGAINAIKEGLSFLPDDEDLIIYLKYLTSQKERAVSIIKSDSDLQLEKDYMSQAVEAYSIADYQNAKNFFAKVLEINFENGMAKFYLNKIALALGEKNSLFTQEDEDDIILYKRVSEGISLYNAHEYWQAYQIFRDIYVDNPYNYEVFDYYNLAMAKIKLNDFFITDAQFLYDVFVVKRANVLASEVDKDNVFNILSFPINYDSVCNIEFFKLSEDNYFYSTVLNIYNETYFFDTVLFSRDNGTNTYTKYRYGKLVPSIKSGEYDIVLKGLYGSDGSHSEDDFDYHTVTISIPANLFDVAKHIDATDFVSIVDMITLLEYMPKFGFDEKEILSTLMYKMFLPLELLLIVSIISYYSMRYRAKSHVHIIHKISGFLGSVLLTFMILQLFAMVTNMLAIVSTNYVGFIIFASLAFVFVIAFGIQFFRVKIDEPN